MKLTVENKREKVLSPWLVWGPVVSEPVKPYFTRLLRVLTFCLGASKIVIFCENGVIKLAKRVLIINP